LIVDLWHPSTHNPQGIVQWWFTDGCLFGEHFNYPQSKHCFLSNPFSDDFKSCGRHKLSMWWDIICDPEIYIYISAPTPPPHTHTQKNPPS
jgi:hypothetical protein